MAGFEQNGTPKEGWNIHSAMECDWIGVPELSSHILMSLSRCRTDRWGLWLFTSLTAHRMKLKPDYLKA